MAHRFSAALVIGGVAAALVVLVGVPSVLNYDTLYHLVWGRELAGGDLPSYEGDLTPTPHPLLVLVGALLSPLGEPELLAVVTVGGYVAVGAVAWLAGALAVEWRGEHAAALAAAALAVVLVVTREPVFSFGARAYVDLPYVALVLAAVLTETRAPAERPTRVLVLLALAGLLRPEAWLLSAAYVVWRREPKLLPLAAAAPILWALSDLVVTGDPLYSLTGTREGAAELGRRTGLGDLITYAPFRLGELLGAPLSLAAVAAVAVAAVKRQWTALLVIAAALAAFALLALAGLSILTRYTLLAGVLLLALVAAHAARPLALALLVGVVGVAFTASRLERTQDALTRQAVIVDDLRALAPLADDRCAGRITVPNRRAVPHVALKLDRAPESIAIAQRDGAPRRGLYLVPSTPARARDFVLDRRDRDKRIPPPGDGAREIARNASWIAYASRCA